MFCPLVVLVRLSATVKLMGWKDLSPKWPKMCWWERWTLLTRSLTHPLSYLSAFESRLNTNTRLMLNILKLRLFRNWKHAQLRPVTSIDFL